MTPDELRAAAERLLKSAQVSGKGQPWDTGLAFKAVYKGTEFTRIEDEKTVCEAWLAEHPADDGEPATIDDAEQALAGLDATVNVRIGRLWVDIGGLTIRTRRDLRLLAALLTEATP